MGAAAIDRLQALAAGRPTTPRPMTPRLQPTGSSSTATEANDRSVRRRVALAWVLLFANTLTYVADLSLLPLPSILGKAFTQGALPLAILVLLSLNRRVVIRPDVFLGLMSLLVVDTLITCVWSDNFGTVYRTARLTAYVVALWLMTPWWGRRDMLILRVHVRCLFVMVASALLGLLVAPGKAFAFDSRLTGIIWPMFPTQLAQYAALAMGLTVVLWLGRLVRGRMTVLAVAIGMAALILSHTRTAMLGLVAGLLVAGISVFASNSRVQRFFLAAVVTVVVGTPTVANVITTWVTRGQNAEGLVTLTGRTNFWTLVLNEPRTISQEVFGFGLSNASINGLPIDSNWLAAYQQEGLVGVSICALILVWLFLTAFFQPQGTRRAVVLFVLTYCLLASVTEDAFTNASTYLLDLVAAASLLAVAPRPAGRERVPRSSHDPATGDYGPT